MAGQVLSVAVIYGLNVQRWLNEERHAVDMGRRWKEVLLAKHRQGDEALASLLHSWDRDGNGVVELSEYRRLAFERVLWAARRASACARSPCPSLCELSLLRASFVPASI